MSVLKAIGLICMIAGAAGVGYSMSVQAGLRYRQLCELLRLVALLMGEISFGQTPLWEAFEAAGEKLEEPVSSFSRHLAAKLQSLPKESFHELFCREAAESLHNSCLSKKDVEAFCSMGRLLGHLDKDMQLHALEMYREELKKEIEETRRAMPAKKKLCQTLGLMGGLFLVILLL